MERSVISRGDFQEVLSSKFDNVGDVSFLDGDVVNSATQARTSTVFTFEGLQCVVGVYTHDSNKKIKNGEAEFSRFLCVSNRFFYSF